MAIPRDIESVIYYKPDTGEFIWRVSPSGSVSKGDPAGYVSKSNGYLYIRYKGKQMRAHRLAYYLMGLPIPEQIDHKDGVRTNNRWNNLREANAAENGWNRRGTKNALGIKGIRYHKGRYEARLDCAGEHHSARFSNLTQAQTWLNHKRQTLHKEYANGG